MTYEQGNGQLKYKNSCLSEHHQQEAVIVKLL